jgi:hypothetical protein
MNFLKLPVDQQPQFLPMECGSADGMMQMLRCMVVTLQLLCSRQLKVRNMPK